MASGSRKQPATETATRRRNQPSSPAQATRPAGGPSEPAPKPKHRRISSLPHALASLLAGVWPRPSRLTGVKSRPRSGAALGVTAPRASRAQRPAFDRRLCAGQRTQFPHGPVAVRHHESFTAFHSTEELAQVLTQLTDPNDALHVKKVSTSLSLGAVRPFGRGKPPFRAWLHRRDGAHCACRDDLDDRQPGPMVSDGVDPYREEDDGQPAQKPDRSTPFHSGLLQAQRPPRRPWSPGRIHRVRPRLRARCTW